MFDTKIKLKTHIYNFTLFVMDKKQKHAKNRTRPSVQTKNQGRCHHL